MDNRDKLKNRLNLKFQGLPNHNYSLKKLESLSNGHSLNINLNRGKSNSHLKLPSLHHNTKLSSESSQMDILSVLEIKNKVKSISVRPRVTAQTKQPIHQTINYLLQKSILSVPKIVGLLQKSQSQQFLYMKVVGIYQYEVCSEEEKGQTYVTISKNGMVSEGNLIPLERLIYQFEIYTKLKKIHFFKYFTQVKFMNKWNRGSKIAQFIENKRQVEKLLNMENPKLLEWKTQLTLKLQFIEKGGWFNNTWMQNVTDQVQRKRNEVHNRMAQVMYQMLQQFKLPISESTVLMNKVLGNMAALNMTFEKKIRIEKQLKTFYRFARHLQFYFYHSIGSFIITHIQTLILRVHDACQQYKTNILQELQKMDINKQNYVIERDRILANSPVLFDIDYRIIIDSDLNAKIEPSAQDLYIRFASQIKTFINLLQSLNLCLVRTNQFAFVTNNVIKLKPEYDDKNDTIKQYILSLSDYAYLMAELEQEFKQFQIVIDRKIKLLDPFINAYKSFKNKPPKQLVGLEDEVTLQNKRIDDAIELCNKIDQGEFFIFGYLNQVELKKQIKQTIIAYKQAYLEKLPVMIRLLKIKIEIQNQPQEVVQQNITQL